MLNRGNYRQSIFEEEGAKATFERTLFEACERAGWVLHAHCIMDNHYHLALETPAGNLSEGMRWLQSVFANRFNRFRKESGHLFQGRFKSLVVEDSNRLAWLAHYIHLNPVRAGICLMGELPRYRWSSLWYLQSKKTRPSVMRLSTGLSGAGGLNDTPSGRQRYLGYLDWLQEDEPARKEMAFERMSRGWAIGSEAFKRDLVETNVRSQRGEKLTYAEAQEARALLWDECLGRCLDLLGKASADCAKEPKSAPWKVAIAALMKSRLMTTNAWLADRLEMGTTAGVSRYATEALAGKRADESRILRRLIAKIPY